MSADNWRACPQCSLVLDVRFTKLQQRAEAAYGSVTKEEFLAMLQDAERAKKAAEEFEHDEKRHTFREDFQVYTNTTGELQVSYSGVCNICAYEVRFSEQKMFMPKPPTAEQLGLPDDKPKKRKKA